MLNISIRKYSQVETSNLVIILIITSRCTGSRVSWSLHRKTPRHSSPTSFTSHSNRKSTKPKMKTVNNLSLSGHWSKLILTFRHLLEGSQRSVKNWSNVFNSWCFLVDKINFRHKMWNIILRRANNRKFSMKIFIDLK